MINVITIVENLTCSDIVQAATRSQSQNTTCQNGEISIELCVEQDAAGFLRWLWREHVLSRVDFGGSKPVFFLCPFHHCVVAGIKRFKPVNTF